jgi:hypothetical protein
VVLVRAVEETLPRRIAPEILLEAHAAAGDTADEAGWIARRAAYLVDHALARFRGVLERAPFGLPGAWPLVGLGAVAGLASNYLGPSQRIHVVLNPIVALVLWNLCVYAALAVRRLLRGRVPSSPSAPARAVARGRGGASEVAPIAPGGLLERVVLGAVRRWLLTLRRRAGESLEDARDAGAVAARFAVLWWPLARPALTLQLRRLAHLVAIGLALGAIAGMYARGLFLAYRVVWESTFVDDPEAIALVLRWLLGPAALLLGRAPPGPDDALRLLAPEGDPAAAWMHLYAVTALGAIVAPRGVLALAAGRARVARDVALDLAAPYFADLLRRARAVSPDELEASVRGAVAQECREFVERLVALICRELYDGRIVPRLTAFREQGGRLDELESALARECEAFLPTLERELPGAQRELEHALLARIRRLLGAEQGFETRSPGVLVGDVGAASSVAALRLGDRVGADLATLVAAVISTSVALAAGTLSGGFGKALGVALLVGLLHSGPAGWVVGALGGLVASGAAFWLGREQLRSSIKTVPLPALALRAVLWRGRWDRLLADGRAHCAHAVAQALEPRVGPLAAVIADQIWSGLRTLVGELQRPRVPVRNAE